jgi:hypothetical protein
MSVLTAISVFRELRDATCPISRFFAQVEIPPIEISEHWGIYRYELAGTGCSGDRAELDECVGLLATGEAKI